MKQCAVMQAQAQALTQFIRYLLSAGHPAQEVAVLYPLHKYGDAVEDALVRAQVPVQRYGRNSIAERCASF